MNKTIYTGTYKKHMSDERTKFVLNFTFLGRKFHKNSAAYLKEILPDKDILILIFLNYLNI